MGWQLFASLLRLIPEILSYWKSILGRQRLFYHNLLTKKKKIFFSENVSTWVVVNLFVIKARSMNCKALKVRKKSFLSFFTCWSIEYFFAKQFIHSIKTGHKEYRKQIITYFSINWIFAFKVWTNFLIWNISRH